MVISEDITPPVPDIDYTFNQEIDCNNASIILDATGSAPFGVLDFEWETSNGVILSGGSTPNPEFGQAGTYVLTITNTENGCTNSQSIEIIANLEVPTALINTPQLLTCITDEIGLDATSSSMGNFTYSWSSNPAGGIVSGGNTLQPTINQAGSYQLTVFNNDNGCQNTAEIEVLEDTTPPNAVAATEEEFDCITESITLSGEGSSVGNEFTYQWSGNGTIDNETSLSPTIYQAGVYSLQVTNTENGCSESTSIEVMENEDMPTAMEIISNDPLCYGQTGDLAVISITGGEGPYLYSIDGGVNYSATNVFPNLSSGTYEVLIQDVNGCELEEVITINAVDLLTVQLPVEVTLELGQNYQIEAVTNIDTSQIAEIIWSPTENLSCTNCLNPRLDTIQDEIQYRLTIINENGCQASAQILLRVDKTREVYIPNAFSPGNADGQNDRFIIYANNDKIKQVNTFRIYDRWGEQVYLAENFQPNDPAYGWRGTFNDEQLNPAVFVYFAEIEFIDGVKIIYKGDVTILE